MINWFWRLLGYKEPQNTETPTEDRERELLTQARQKITSDLREKAREIQERREEREEERKNRKSIDDSAQTAIASSLIFDDTPSVIAVESTSHHSSVDHTPTFHGGEFGGGGAGSSWSDSSSSDSGTSSDSGSSSCDSGSSDGGSSSCD